MGSVGDCFDNSVAESFFGTLQLELLDEHRWTTRQHLALAIFEWIESLVQPEAPPQLLQDAQPRGLRGRIRGMISTTNLSARPGEANSSSRSMDSPSSRTEKSDGPPELSAQPVELVLRERLRASAVSNVLGDHQERSELVWGLNVSHVVMA